MISIAYALYLIKQGLGTGTIVPILKFEIPMPVLIYIPFAIFVMLAATNAVNLTDGIDGLGASISMIIIACLSVIAAKYGILEITVLGCVLCGACLGFLIFNLHPAKIFMGDTGSLLLRRSNSSNGIIPKNATYTNHRSNYPSTRNNICNITSVIL
ncbi:MAG: hypothetical protein HFJ52_02745 [Clostridia bacterium]|nr:hypothetical protein [Clostridia bacterium]